MNIMAEFPQEEIKKRYDSLPQSLRELMFSEEKSDVLWEIGEAYHINDAKLSIISRLIGYVILGLVRPEDLQKKIESEAHIDGRIAQSLSEDIEKKILSQSLSDIQALYNQSTPDAPISAKTNQQSGLLSPAFKPQGIPSQTLPPNTTPTQTTPPLEPPKPPEKQTTPTPDPKPKSLEEKLAPSTPTPRQPESPKEPLVSPNISDEQEAPFMLHEEERIEPLASGDMAPLTRPHFFKSTASDEEEPVVSARLEIGQEQTRPSAPVVGRTKKESVRVVNYTDPEVSVDPFAKTPGAAETPQSQTPAPKHDREKEIPPDNIVNLKDLPK